MSVRKALHKSIHFVFLRKGRLVAMIKKSLLLTLLLSVLILAACGSYAEPIPNAATREAEAAADDVESGETEAEVVVVVPTNTLAPPTETVVPPTATPIPVEPTQVPPTEVVEEAPEEISQEFQDIVIFVEFGDSTNGERLFNEMRSVEMVGGVPGEWACSTCHNINSDDPGVGPGMLSIAERAGERVPSMPAPVYVYNSIIHPEEYIVEGFQDGIMPVGYADVFTEGELYDIAKYLSTLGQ